MSKTFCPIPWIMFAVRSNGDVRLCCHANQGPDLGLLRDEKGDTYNLSQHKIEETKNASLLRAVRLASLKGEKHPECRRCWNEEASGIRSRRLSEIEYWKDYLTPTEAAKLTNPDGRVADDLERVYFDIRLGNHCNLKCRMCHCTDSSAWYDDFVQLFGRTKYKDSHGIVQLEKKTTGYEPVNRDYDWCLSDNFWSDLSSKVKNIRKIYLIGGEPMLIERHYEFLEECINAGEAQNIVLEYNTNFTILPDRVLALWPAFKKVQIGLSMDAIGEVNDFIRFPSKWPQVLKNLEKLEQSPGNYSVWLATTIQIYNALYFTELIKWSFESSLLRNINNSKYNLFHIKLHPLHLPDFLNIKILPLEVKLQVQNRIIEFREWFLAWLESERVVRADFHKKEMIKILDSYVDFMNKDDWSSLLPNFWKYTRKLDEIRGQNIEKSLPELYELIKHTEKNA